MTSRAIFASDVKRACDQLSLARTALDDGFAWDGVNNTNMSPEEMRDYVIDKLDKAIYLLEGPEPSSRTKAEESLAVVREYINAPRENRPARSIPLAALETLESQLR